MINICHNCTHLPYSYFIIMKKNKMLKALMRGQLEPYFIYDVRLFDSFFFVS